MAQEDHVLKHNGLQTLWSTIVSKISSMISGKMDTEATTLNSVDLNTQTTAGFYYCTNCTNVPGASGVTVASNGYLWVFEEGNGAIRQVWKDQIDSNSIGYNEFEREYIESTWTNWKRLAAKSVQIPNTVATATGASANNVEDALSGLADGKAPLASPALTGNPTAPTQAAGNNSTRIATTAFVNTALNDYGHLYNISLTIAGNASGTADLKPDTGTYSVWLITVGYNSTSGVNDYVGLIFVGSSKHVLDIAKGSSSNVTIAIAANGVATITNGVSVYARVGLTRVYRSDS